MDNIEICKGYYEIVVKTTKVRNTCLNFFEALACIFIMLHLGHAPFPGEFGKIIACIGNFAVPLFFVVSGYYLIKPNMTKEDLRDKLKVRIKKMLFLLLFSFIIYTIISFIKKDFGEEVLTTGEWFKEHFLSLKRWVKFLLFNFPLVEPINWYILASIYCYVIIYIFADLFLNKKLIINVLIGSMPIWIIYGLCINKFNPSLFGFELSSLESIPRTWFAVGLPFISLGILLKRYEDKFKSIKYNPELVIGNYVSMARNNHIGCMNKITIGNNVLIESNVLIENHSHGNTFDYSKPRNELPLVTNGEIVIGDNVWICDNAVILAGAHIGNNCVVAANSVVKKEFPDNCLIGGIPAKIIKKLN